MKIHNDNDRLMHLFCKDLQRHKWIVPSRFIRSGDASFANRFCYRSEHRRLLRLECCVDQCAAYATSSSTAPATQPPVHPYVSPPRTTQPDKSVLYVDGRMRSDRQATCAVRWSPPTRRVVARRHERWLVFIMLVDCSLPL